MTQMVFLDDNDELRQVMAELFHSYMGLECLGFKSLSALQQNWVEIQNCRLAVLDIELGPREPSGIDAFYWLRENGFSGEIFFLTGHGRSHPLVAQAVQAGGRIWEKPISVKQIIAVLSYQQELV
jgi:FixJ family two-component response regulator